MLNSSWPAFVGCIPHGISWCLPHQVFQLVISMLGCIDYSFTGSHGVNAPRYMKENTTIATFLTHTRVVTVLQLVSYILGRYIVAFYYFLFVLSLDQSRATHRALHHRPRHWSVVWLRLYTPHLSTPLPATDLHSTTHPILKAAMQRTGRSNGMLQ
ncbi:hypothetical protein BDV95DRAFT_35712 [Massariosphaeria phaeospora]|uniref:Uncharacterized protein n=1 Tax=Massariosphaeria phaeospora TaxID=100035 RepID=A0A7C8I6Q2_9PLEO|nr:hypothetical protein BDV95DRAFT_35712 [Massariosphaeria phaeospora]